MNLQPLKYTAYTRPQGRINKALIKAKTREEQTYLRAQLRAHRRLDKYCAVVAHHKMEWKMSRHTKAWRLVREATALLKKLEKIQ